MAVTVRIPAILLTATEGASRVRLEAGTVGELLRALEQLHPDLRDRVLDEDGALHRFMNVYVGDDCTRLLSGLATEVPDGSELTILPAVAGG